MRAELKKLGSALDLDHLSQTILDDWGALADSSALMIEWADRDRSQTVGHREGIAMEFGSCFKAFVAAECCRQVEQEALR
jgi:hypothetical protein